MRNVHPVYGARDSNPRFLEGESLPITTRPGLPPKPNIYLKKRFPKFFNHKELKQLKERLRSLIAKLSLGESQVNGMS